MTVDFPPATADDLDALVALRIAAMRESLERIGRFDPVRARERFVAGFDPARTRHIAVDGARVGFFVVTPGPEAIALDHLYLHPDFQGRGIGAAVLARVFADADAAGLPVTVGALKQSASNRFYQRHGFVPTGEGEWDLYYTRPPRLNLRPFAETDRDAVIALWRRCDLVRPQNDPNRDIDRKLRVRPDLFLVGIEDGAVVASVMVGYDGHRGWINYLAVDPERQRRGYGRQLMDAAEALLRAEGCPKINLQVRTSNASVLAFYAAIGYALDEVVSLGKRLEHDAPG